MSQLLIYPAASAWVTSFWNLLIDLFFHPITVLTTEQFFTYVCYQTSKGGHQLTTTKEQGHATLFQLADLSPEIRWMFLFVEDGFCFTKKWPKTLMFLTRFCHKNKTQTAVTNICLNCITFINLTFRTLQHASSEVIIIQLQFLSFSSPELSVPLCR